MAKSILSPAKDLHNTGIHGERGITAKQQGIYAIIHVETNRCYVGSAIRIDRRWAAHRSQLKALKHGNSKLQSGWNKHGAVAFRLEVIQRVESPDNLLVWEQFWIDKLKPFYNLRIVANSNLGMKFSDETRAKMSASGKGKRKGWVHSDETKAKMSTAAKGRVLSDETKAKLSASGKGKGKGKIISDEMRAKLSAANKGRVHTDETKAKMSIAQQNMPPRVNNTSGVKGVYLHKPNGKWHAGIRVLGKKKSLGYFVDINDAAAAYKEAAAQRLPTSPLFWRV